MEYLNIPQEIFQMPLYIRDDKVDALATQLQRETNASSKTEAVRIALLHELERNRARKPLRERVAVFQAQAAALGPSDPNFNMKAFMDEAWED
jgi:antitoxin VapB